MITPQPRLTTWLERNSHINLLGIRNFFPQHIHISGADKFHRVCQGVQRLAPSFYHLISHFCSSLHSLNLVRSNKLQYQFRQAYTSKLTRVFEFAFQMLVLAYLIVKERLPSDCITK